MRNLWRRLCGRARPALPDHLRLGTRGEDCACRHLRQEGLRILKRNFRSPRGEIDVVARHGTTLVFVEVKTRRTPTATRPASAVSAEQKKRIVAAATDYFRRIGRPPVAVRFDIVEVLFDERDIPRTQWLLNAFSPQESAFHPNASRRRTQ